MKKKFIWFGFLRAVNWLSHSNYSFVIVKKQQHFLRVFRIQFVFGFCFASNRKKCYNLYTISSNKNILTVMWFVTIREWNYYAQQISIMCCVFLARDYFSLSCFRFLFSSSTFWFHQKNKSEFSNTRIG